MWRWVSWGISTLLSMYVLWYIGQPVHQTLQHVAAMPLSANRVVLVRADKVEARWRAWSGMHGEHSVDWIATIKDIGSGQATSEMPVTKTPHDSSHKPWVLPAGKDRMWAGDAKHLHLFDFASDVKWVGHDGVLSPTLPGPWTVHPRRHDALTKELVVRDAASRWWRVAADLSAQPTTEEDIEQRWKKVEASARVGCSSGEHYSDALLHKEGPDRSYERPTWLVDSAKNCQVESTAGPLLVHHKVMSDGRDEAFLSVVNKRTSIWEWRDHLRVTCMHPGLPALRTTSPDGASVAMAFSNGGVCVVDLKNGDILWTVPAHVLADQSDTYQPRLVASEVLGDGTFELWLSDVAQMKRVRVLPHDKKIMGRLDI